MNWTTGQPLLGKPSGRLVEKLLPNVAIATYRREPNEYVKSLQRFIGKGNFRDKRVLVIGTEYPWLEGVALWLGAKEVVTLEYGQINCTHPQVTTLVPSEFRRLYQMGQLEPFDIVLSFSSLERPGLGRYGDALNPWGDLLAVARAYCVTKPGGFLGLSLPANPKGHDLILFNGARYYGPIRWALMASNWKQIDKERHQTELRTSRMEHIPYIFQKPVES